MRIEYLTFQFDKIYPKVLELVSASENLEAARKKRDKKSRKIAENRINNVTRDIVGIDPHISFLLIKSIFPKLEVHIRENWSPDKDDNFLYLKKVGVFQSLPEIENLPPCSWTIHIPFILQKPYISQDDTDFYIIDNPVKKEWVFKVPYVAPSQWKGALRAAMRKLKGYSTFKQEANDQQMVRLFGNANNEDNEFSSGCLFFYPTYFNRIGLEVINPHKRDTGVGKQPIYFECVPIGTEGQFTVLYAPLHGKINKGISESDFVAVAKGIEAMLTIYGFGAKTSSGFGVADVDPDKAIVKPQEKKKTWLEVWREKV